MMSKDVKFANFLLATGMLFFAGLIFYVLLSGKSYSPGSMHAFYIIGISGVIFLGFVLLKCRDELKVRIALLCISLVFCVYMTEVVLHLYTHLLSGSDKSFRERQIEYFLLHGIPFDSRTREEVIRDLRNDGIDAYPNLAPHTFIPSEGILTSAGNLFPFGSVSDAFSVICNENGEWMTYETDEHGFRNPKGNYGRGDIDFVLIGDSYAQGICVQDGDDMAGWLRKSGKTVMTFGIGSNGPLIELGTLKEYVELLKPRFVIWLYYEGNDMMSLTKESESPILIRYLEKEFSQNLRSRQGQIDDALLSYAERRLEFHEEGENRDKQIARPGFKISFKNILRLASLRYRIGQKEECSFHENPLFRDVLVKARGMVSSWGGELVFVYLPEWSRYMKKKNVCRTNSLDLQKDYVLSLVKRENILSVDIDDVISSHNDIASLFPLGRLHRNHYNATGYRVIIEEILENVPAR